MKHISKDIFAVLPVEQQMELIIRFSRTRSDNGFLTLLEDAQHLINDVAIRMLQHNDVEHRCSGADILLHLDPVNNAPFIFPLLHDPEAAVRYYACGLLYDEGNEAAVDELLQLVQREENIDVLTMAIYALGAIGNSRALPVLNQFIHDLRENAQCFSVATVALGSIDTITNNSGN